MPWEVEQIGDCTLYRGDCLEVLPTLGPVDGVITDPPYPGYEYSWPIPDLSLVPLPVVHTFIFWPCLTDFPLTYSARHIWSKCNVCIGDAEPYEEIYELQGKMTSLVFRHAVINCEMNAMMNGDIYYKHPTQKPLRLIYRLVKRMRGGIILDPFMGCGTTGAACIKLQQSFIGIEIEKKYFDIACRRLEETYKQVPLFPLQPMRQSKQLVLL